MDISSLVQSQIPIDRSIASDIIAATPESWQSAAMSARRILSGNNESFRIEIVSPEGHRELVSPTPDLFEHIKQLSDLFGRHDRPWLEAKYVVSLKPSGDWGYQVDFIYQ